MRIGFVVFWTVVGLGLLVAATALMNGWTDAQFWSSVLVNLGTTIFLAGFLVWLERRFVATARTVAREAATTAATEAANVAAEEATRVLSERLDAIQDRFERHREAQVRKEDEKVAALADEVSYARVLEALTTAQHLGAIGAPLYATAGTSLAAPIIGVQTWWESGPSYVQHNEPELLGLIVSVDTDAYPKSQFLVQVEWSPDEDPVAVFGNLRSEMVRHGYGPQSQLLDVETLFKNIRMGIKDAVAGRRGDAGSWQSPAPLLDVISPEWVVTSSGLEHRMHGLVAGKEKIGTETIPGGRSFSPPPTPEWADADSWDEIVLRARRRVRAASSFWGV